MRTNIDIDDDLMAAAMKAGPYKTKKEAVEAGLLLLKRQAAYREILKFRGQLQWGWGDEAEEANDAPAAAEPAKAHRAAAAKPKAEKARGRR
ncbi:type II toxin-antitoxin system VapB family antitoxin [Roseateles cellulosilyticus]|uniref:Type II toxin-antitoxin system VapB family antitoxin n=1 Tax=Pelomonas cellulosilytica TaxID=2906762 RepID=A0ABS8Y2T3_9BURK|nr:type II toxin-antitoxin system VapB family antitoxin [Pelomonas sp. P8]MCE4557301.1 type II toxin-antitoxin system VapB family antitoxin [Pelomonas sp. P8]